MQGPVSRATVGRGRFFEAVACLRIMPISRTFTSNLSFGKTQPRRSEENITDRQLVANIPCGEATSADCHPAAVSPP